MGIQFDWQQDEDLEGSSDPSPSKSKRKTGVLWMILATALVSLAVGGWFLGQKSIEAGEATLVAQVNNTLLLEQQATLAGDGDLFLSLQSNDPGWLSLQIRPENRRFLRADKEATRAQQIDKEVWANVTWQENGEQQQRLAFFRWQDGNLVRAATAFNYWRDIGGVNITEHSWGTMIVPEGDKDWENSIAAAVARTIDENCGQECRQSNLPLKIRLTKEITPRPLDSDINIPSPRLIALNSAGEPAQPFYDALETAILDRILPATIRFVLPAGTSAVIYRNQYEGYAARFMAQENHNVQIELIDAQDLPDNPTEWLPEVDGAILPLTESMLTTGLIYDLTPFALADTEFDVGDFYAQIWPGAWWQDRLWLVPFTAGMNVVYYDQQTFQQNPIPPNANWEELTAISTQFAQVPNPDYNETWGFFDPSLDALFAYAFSYETNCDSGPCIPDLTPAKVAAALNWYSTLLSTPNLTPDLSEMPAAEREIAARGLLSAHTKVFSWVDAPVNLEYHMGLQTVGVIPYPIPQSESPSISVAPLHINGHIMSASTKHPYWTWQWLKFLSYQAPPAWQRQIPARPSVARQSGFWATVPPQLADTMKTAFPLARPIQIGEKSYFTWEQLNKITIEQINIEEAAQFPPKTKWFGR